MCTIREIESSKYLCLLSISEPRDNQLRLLIRQAGISPAQGQSDTSAVGPHTSFLPIEADGRIFEIIWDYYLGYGVRNESNAAIDPCEVGVGRVFRVCTKSRFLDYLAVACVAHETCGDPLTHWNVNCLNHTIDIVGPGEPCIREIQPNELPA